MREEIIKSIANPHLIRYLKKNTSTLDKILSAGIITMRVISHLSGGHKLNWDDPMQPKYYLSWSHAKEKFYIIETFSDQVQPEEFHAPSKLILKSLITIAGIDMLKMALL